LSSLAKLLSGSWWRLFSLAKLLSDSTWRLHQQEDSQYSSPEQFGFASEHFGFASLRNFGLFQQIYLRFSHRVSRDPGYFSGQARVELISE
jgi:hypothetical protein